MFRLKESTSGSLPPTIEPDVGFGIIIINASDDSPDLYKFIDLIDNPCKYRGRVVYITALGPTPRPDPFLFANKFYFNEDCQWFESPFTFNGMF